MKVEKTDALWVASTAASRASMQVAKTADSMVEQRAETKDIKTAEH